MITTEQLTSDFNLVLKFFRGHCKTVKIFLSNIFNNEIITNKNFSEYIFISPVVVRKLLLCSYSW